MQSFTTFAPDNKLYSTYSDKKLGFNLQYPATWHDVELKNNWIAFCATDDSEGVFCDNVIVKVINSQVLAQIENREKSAKDIFQKQLSLPSVSEGNPPKRAAVGNMQGFRYAVSQVAPNRAKLRQESYLALKDTRQFYLTYTTPSENNSDNHALFDKILKSFHADEIPVKWVEHRDEQQAFTINYPDNWVKQPVNNVTVIFLPKRVTEKLYDAMIMVSGQSADMNFDLERITTIQKQNDEREKGYHLSEERSS